MPETITLPRQRVEQLDRLAEPVVERSGQLGQRLALPPQNLPAARSCSNGLKTSGAGFGTDAGCELIDWSSLTQVVAEKAQRAGRLYPARNLGQRGY